MIFSNKIRAGALRPVALMIMAVMVAAMASDRAMAQQKKRQAAQAPSLSAEEMAGLEAVITTEQGVIRFEFFPEKAPKHVQKFITHARGGNYDGSAFHRVIPRGLIQGGDPLLKEPRAARARWGTGGLNEIADEFSDIKHERGTVSTVRLPGRANSGGQQFFICASAQPSLDGKYSAFGQVTEGIEVVDKISVIEADKNFIATAPVKIVSIKIEPKKTEPFKSATKEEMKKEVLLKTSLGEITVELYPDLAPEHVRNFLKLVESGWYDHTAFHRVIPGFVIQGGMAETRAGNQPHPADKWVRPLKGEFGATKHTRGILSMARTDDPDSATTSFFIVLGPASHLDGKYTVFGRVVSGFDTLENIEKVARDGETPRERVELIEAAIKP